MKSSTTIFSKNRLGLSILFSLSLIAGIIFLGGFTEASPKANAPLSDEGMIGEIRMFGGNFAPRNWAKCEGQLLPISNNQALFSILGTTYGGDGRTTFGLPDMRGRVAMGPGTGPGLANIRLGQKTGSQQTTLKKTKMEVHKHQASKNAAASKLAVTTASSVSTAQPAVAVNFIICTQGIFPSRN